ncbi:MC076 [Molluscum contagiosum virus subtype 2]|uniref:Cap-specific mRNA (nucleoside-2'-O-)-methyltransferase n=2 Tax=Molluscum contagiosum virus TaxID=10279 RepID=A0A1S7DLR4_MCV2|nr:MC076 [Molluscum contagiosum virus subtype 2]QHW16464.1 MC076R [Molluscum contagiosum virus]AYO87711.1 MC076 [Molluscum contagiosum virus subtype 2]AYO87881.1 MC076 [Molluscum contagiosum virus subtype 2]AYO88051.1 MC076 [Molluscum contagiosum virus subtype 2]
MEAQAMERPLLYFHELTQTQEYDAEVERAARSRFPAQGQLKLLIGELFFLNKLHRREMLAGATVVYIGSAPGGHIRYLVEHFRALGVPLRWMLLDGRSHDSRLQGLPDVTLVTRFVDERYLLRMRQALRGARVVLISDIRSRRGSEPSTEDLLYDYALQNSMLSILKPVASSLKWRCPFPDQWLHNFYVVCGKELLQPFAPPFSAELRLLSVHAGAPRLRCIMPAAARDYEKKMFYLNNVIRRRIVLNFDYPNQEYDFFHMFHLLNTVLCPRSFDSPTKKVLFLQQSIFRFLGIQLPLPEKLPLPERPRKHEPAQRGVPGQDPVSEGRGRAKPVRGRQQGAAE